MLANTVYDSSDDEEDDELIMALSLGAATVVTALLEGNHNNNVDWRQMGRKTRTKYDHARAHKCVMDDYLGPVPRFDFKEFVSMFRVTRGRFQTIMEDFARPIF